MGVWIGFLEANKDFFVDLGGLETLDVTEMEEDCFQVIWVHATFSTLEFSGTFQ